MHLCVWCVSSAISFRRCMTLNVCDWGEVMFVFVWLCSSVFAACKVKANTQTRNKHESGDDCLCMCVCVFCVRITEIPNICIRIEYWFVVVTQSSFVCLPCICLFVCMFICFSRPGFCHFVKFCLIVSFVYVTVDDFYFTSTQTHTRPLCLFSMDWKCWIKTIENSESNWMDAHMQ